MTEKQRNMSYALAILVNVLGDLELITQKTNLKIIRVTDSPAIDWAGIQWDKKMAKRRPKYHKYSTKYLAKLRKLNEHSPS